MGLLSSLKSRLTEWARGYFYSRAFLTFLRTVLFWAVQARHLEKRRKGLLLPTPAPPTLT